MIVLSFSGRASGQEVKSPENVNGRFERAIEDNSFFIEEAYNQEDRVVQHIANWSYFPSPRKAFELTFTQEWPVFSQVHQFSYTLPYQGMNGAGAFGDMLLNYRYQLLDGGDWAAVAPRVSVLLRTGTGSAASGSRTPGWQFNLPVSKRISNGVTVHLNAGASVEPGFYEIRGDGSAVRRTLTSYGLGASIIWLATRKLNLLAESVVLSAASIGDNGGLTRDTETILSPGIRYAIDSENLQIVPGLAVPVRFDGDGGNAGLYFYLSFEHPF